MSHNRCRRRGFSLVEAALATAIVGVGVVALLVSTASTARTSESSQRLGTAAFLAQEMREWTVKLDFSDLAALGCVTYSPPRDGQGSPIADMAGWSQQLSVTYRNMDNLALATTAATDVVQVGVSVSYRNKPTYSTNWLVSRKE